MPENKKTLHFFVNMSSDQDLQKIYQLEARMKNDLPSASVLHPCKRVSPLIINESFPIECNGNRESENKSIFNNKNNCNDSLKNDENLQRLSNNLKTPENMKLAETSVIENSIDLKTNQKLNEMSVNLNNEDKNDEHLKSSGLKRKKNESDGSNDCGFQFTAIINNMKITDFFFKRNELQPSEKNINFRNLNLKILEKKTDNSNIEAENNKLKEDIRRLNRKIVEKETLIEQTQIKFKDLTQENKILLSELNKKEETVQVLIYIDFFRLSLYLAHKPIFQYGFINVSYSISLY